MRRASIKIGRVATLYRTMRKEYDGRPVVASSASLLSPARALGVRPEIDIPVDDDGYVGPGEDGMSVSQDSPEHLPSHRRPRWLGGESDDPLWQVEEDDI